MRIDPNEANLLTNAPGVVVTGAGYVLVARWQPNGSRCLVELINIAGGQALTGLRIARAITAGGTALDLAVDADFTALASAGGSVEIQSVVPSAPHTLATGATAQIVVNTSAVGELLLFARTGGTTTVVVRARQGGFGAR